MSSDRAVSTSEIDDVLDRLEVWHGPSGRPASQPHGRAGEERPERS